jgi:hypothetical protein
MKANFTTGIDRDTFGGALLYNLQWEEGASISTQLLVIWGYNPDGSYLRVRRIEHENTYNWDKDKLKELYDVYSSPDKSCACDDWKLDNSTRLGILCSMLYSGSKMDVTIYH